MDNHLNNNSSKKTIWTFPWKYKESFVIAFGLLLIGFLIEIFGNGKALYSPTWPINIIILISLLVYILFTYFFVKHPLINWLSSIPAAVSAIVVFTILVLLMGFIPQNKENSILFLNKLGLNHITQSFPYVIISLYLFIILGYTIARRLYPINLKNIAFFLNHAGLWIVLAFGSLGSGDIVRLIMPIGENFTVNIAYDDNNNRYQLPFAIKLIDFSIDEYPPHIILANSENGEIITNQHKQKLPDIVQGKTIKLNNWNVFIAKYYRMALISDSIYVPSSDSGAVPAAYLVVTNFINNQKIEGWVSAGSYKCPQNYLLLNSQYLIGMTSPIPKKYSSQIILYTSDNKEKVYTIEVNKPIHINGWEIYQSSYDSEKGSWSSISVFELIRDPWYNAVYIGILMLLLGAVLLFWQGKFH